MTNPFNIQGFERLHKLIKSKSTGTPEKFAQKLGCSKRSIFNKIEKIKDSGIPVEFDSVRQTYYYPVEVKIDFSIVIDGNEMLRIRGGGNCNGNDFESFRHGASKLHSDDGILFCDSRNHKTGGSSIT